MDFAEQVKSSVDIVKVIGEYVHPLKKAGGSPRYTGLCPFHTEKTPSFSVHSGHQFYKCFGCGVSGDVFKFVMEMERISFFEALKLVAERNGIAMPKREYADADAKLRGALMEMHETAARVFQNNLNGPAGTQARQYLAGPPEDRHVEIIHTAGGEYRRPELGGVVQLTTATPALGKLGAAIAWGVQITELVSEVVGQPVFFGHSLAGPFGELAWIGASADAGAWDRTQEALTKDHRYLASLDEGTPNFEVGSGRVLLARRVA